MNTYNPDRHHRRSIRLRGYDYAKAGLYFITLCVQGRDCLFGHIENDEMIWNKAGQMIDKWYYELENKFGDIRCHEMMVMPNHFHCIVENVGADLRVCPRDEHTGSPLHRVCPNESGEQNQLNDNGLDNPPILGGQSESETGGHIGPPQRSPQQGSPLGQVVQWFKTMTTNEYIHGVKNGGWQRFNGKLWQRNYYEHIIRNEKSYQNIANYILNNPANWNKDTLNYRKKGADTQVCPNEDRPNEDRPNENRADTQVCPNEVRPNK